MNKKSFSHILTIDFESWIVSREMNKQNLSDKELYNLDNGYTTTTLNFALDRLKKNHQKITFFIVFRLEKLYPGLIKKILDDGHELGWHGYSHTPITNAKILESELKASKTLLQKYNVKGFQAPYIMFFKEGYSLLKKAGFMYSSSIYGNSTRLYNFDGIYEIPVSVGNEWHDPNESEIYFPSNMSLSNIFRFGIPFGSSYFWSVLRKNYYHKKLYEMGKKKKVANLFIHNWQLMKPQSVSKKYNMNSTIGNTLEKVFFYPYRINVNQMFEHLLENFTFQRTIDYLKSKGITP